MIRIACLTASLLAAIAVTAAAEADPQKPAYGAWGYDLTAIDKDVKPGDQFFEYANGAWYRTAEIPADRSSIGSWAWLRILSESRMKSIMTELDAKPRDQLSDEERKLRDLYDAFEDASQIESRGVAPAKKDLARLQSLKTLNDVATAMGDPLLQLSGPFGANIQLDDKNPNQYAIDILQSGLGLPDREYYIRKGDKNLDTTRAAYKKSMAHMFALAGYTKPAARAEAVYALEARTGAGPLEHRGKSRSDKDLQSHDGVAACGLCTAIPVEGMGFDARHSAAKPARRARADRAAEIRVSEAGRDLRQDAGSGLARLSDRSLPIQFRRLSAESFRR